VVKTAHNKTKSSHDTPIEKFCYIKHYLLHAPSATSSTLTHVALCNILICSVTNVPSCAVGQMIIASFLVCQHTYSAFWCALSYIECIVSVTGPLRACPFNEWLINAVTKAYGRFCIPNNLTFTHKSSELWKILVKQE
jgi:hypothetical protein